jgi:hypothetical protein
MVLEDYPKPGWISRVQRSCGIRTNAGSFIDCSVAIWGVDGSVSQPAAVAVVTWAALADSGISNLLVEANRFAFAREAHSDP